MRKTSLPAFALLMLASSFGSTVSAADAAAMSKDELMAAGEKVYKANCAACHQATGQGMPPTFPSLAGSKVVNGPKAAVIDQILHGKNMMPPFTQLSDRDIAAVTTYVHLSWGNKGEAVQPGEVAAARK
jgi:cytochrome c oxidase subunit 2